MKLITLNIWGGHVNTPLLDFINEHKDVDIFCLQEVYLNAQGKVSSDDRLVHLDIFADIGRLLSEHRGIFRPVVNDSYGVGIFIKNSVAILDEGAFEVYQNPYFSGMGADHMRILQWVLLEADNKRYNVMNFHGLWNGKGKLDAPERIIQSQKVKEFMNALTVPKILAGDFNLRPDTESFKILEENMTNHVALHNVTSTRSRYYPKDEKFADYILTCPDVKVHHFEVIERDVSDHYPLYISFS